MAPKAKRKAKAARGTKKQSTKGSKATVEFPGGTPTAAERKQLEDAFEMMELARVSLTKGAGIMRQFVKRRRR